ncbi:MAG: HDOD domain-containing protein [Acidobacteriota bacterium]|nr:HDOD domain-containing protein [Acidobacteriota bacterium]
MGEEQAFLCGLLHDVGFAGILLVLGDAGRDRQAPDLTAIWPAIDGAHAKAGARMVELWGLPAEYAMVVGAHHQVQIEGYPHPLAATVCLAEDLSRDLHFALAPQPGSGAKDDSGLLAHATIDSSSPATLDTARQALGLTEQVWELIRKDAEAWATSDAAGGAG